MNKPTIPTVPTNVSAFNNDANYITSAAIPTAVSAFTNDAGYLTEYTEQQVLSISNDTIYLTGGSFAKLPAGFSGSYNDLTDIPENVSIFSNDAGYLTWDSLGNYNISPSDIQQLLDRIAALEQQMELPVLNTASATSIQNTSAVSGGTVISSRLAVTARGVCWNTTGSPTISDDYTIDGSGTGNFVSSLSTLTPATTYYVRAYATNDAGTGYGPVVSFTTLDVPAMTTNYVDNIGGTGATIHCSVVCNNGATVTDYGMCWNTTGNPTIGDQKQMAVLGTEDYEVTLTGLTPTTTYYVRAYAINSVGTGYGDVVIFVTATNLPTVTTTAVTAITASSATSGGNVTSDGGATVTARGVCWSTSHNPTTSNSKTANGTGAGNFTSSITGLSESTTYYVRAYATNNVGTAYGAERSFTTPASFVCGTSTITDRDGNTYNTVQIGTQCWMKENLKTTKYADGTSISQGSSNSTEIAYWYYPNSSSSNKATYGLLYNWKAVMRNSSSSSANPSGVQGICPTGWHVPSDAEWKQMEMAVGMSQSSADNTGYRGTIAAKLSGNTGWSSSTNANAAGNLSASGRNSTGFSALPAGGYSGNSTGFGLSAYFWSATEYDSSYAWERFLNYSCAGVGRDRPTKGSGRSVRCLRD